jgi:signal transduction histidine kinase
MGETMSTQENAEVEFMARLGHELRTPVNAMLGYVANLIDGVHGELSPEQRKYLARMYMLSEHLLSIINKSLDAAAIEKAELTLANVPLSEVIVDLELLNRPQINAKRINFDRGTCSAELCHATVRADRTALLQILTNLLSNAIKFTAAGGRITVACVANSGSHMVEVQVTDTGPGIPADQINKVFEPFVRLASDPGGAERGVGLGLAISRELAHAMGGDLRAASTVGVGSTFTLSLPRV